MSAAKKECAVCRGISFYEDDETQMFFCSRCNTQSQELFAESFDADLEEEQQLGGKLITTNKRIRKRKGTLKYRRKIISNFRKSEKDVESYLALFQVGLQIVTESVCKLTRCEALNSRVKEIWFDYLQVWHNSGREISSYLWFDANSIEDSVKSSSLHSPSNPIEPSKHLIYGIIALALRMECSWAECADILRWCKQGLLPLNTLWFQAVEKEESTAGTNRCHAFTSHFKLLDSVFYGDQKSILTAANIFYQMYSIAETIGKVIPPLNAPLVARAYISNLNLPEACWTAFCAITQLSSDSTPLSTLDFRNEHYAANIMAACVASIKLQPDWAAWEYCRSKKEEDPILPQNITELDLVRKCDLDTVLQRTRNNLVGISRLPASKGYANSMKSTFKDCQRSINNSLLVSDNISLSDKVLSSETTSCQQNKRIYAKLQGLAHKRPRASKDPSNFLGSAFMSYLTYVQEAGSMAGVLHPQYIALIERCSKHISITPGLLHLLVSRIDAELEVTVREVEKATAYHRINTAAQRRIKSLSKLSSCRRTRKCGLINDGILAIKRICKGKFTNQSNIFFSKFRNYSKRVLPSLSYVGKLQHISSENIRINENSFLSQSTVESTKCNDEVPPLVYSKFSSKMERIEPSMHQLRRLARKFNQLNRQFDTVESATSRESLIESEDIREIKEPNELSHKPILEPYLSKIIDQVKIDAELSEAYPFIKEKKLEDAVQILHESSQESSEDSSESSSSSGDSSENEKEIEEPGHERFSEREVSKNAYERSQSGEDSEDSSSSTEGVEGSSESEESDIEA